jgi:hypothetical protein
MGCVESLASNVFVLSQMASRAGLAAFLMLLSVLYSFGGRTSSVLSLAH